MRETGMGSRGAAESAGPLDGSRQEPSSSEVAAAPAEPAGAADAASGSADPNTNDGEEPAGQLKPSTAEEAGAAAGLTPAAPPAPPAPRPRGRPSKALAPPAQVGLRRSACGTGAGRGAAHSTPDPQSTATPLVRAAAVRAANAIAVCAATDRDEPWEEWEPQHATRQASAKGGSRTVPHTTGGAGSEAHEPPPKRPRSNPQPLADGHDAQAGLSPGASKERPEQATGGAASEPDGTEPQQLQDPQRQERPSPSAQRPAHAEGEGDAAAGVDGGRERFATDVAGPPGDAAADAHDRRQRRCAECGATSSGQWNTHRVRTGLFTCSRCYHRYYRTGTYELGTASRGRAGAAKPAQVADADPPPAAPAPAAAPSTGACTLNTQPGADPSPAVQPPPLPPPPPPRRRGRPPKKRPLDALGPAPTAGGPDASGSNHAASAALDAMPWSDAAPQAAPLDRVAAQPMGVDVAGGAGAELGAKPDAGLGLQLLLQQPPPSPPPPPLLLQQQQQQQQQQQRQQQQYAAQQQPVLAELQQQLASAALARDRAEASLADCERRLANERAARAVAEARARDAEAARARAEAQARAEVAAREQVERHLQLEQGIGAAREQEVRQSLAEERTRCTAAQAELLRMVGEHESAMGAERHARQEAERALLDAREQLQLQMKRRRADAALLERLATEMRAEAAGTAPACATPLAL